MRSRNSRPASGSRIPATTHTDRPHVAAQESEAYVGRECVSADTPRGRVGACLQAKPASDVASPAAGASLTRDFTAARLRYASLRYEVEARLNQAIANYYELQVRKSNISAERHHNRSQRFFFGMLGAQLGVIIATFAIAARQRNLLWSLAAAAGLLAVAFAIYVYLYV